MNKISFILVLSMFFSFANALEFEIYNRRAKFTCEQFNGRTDYVYEDFYNQKIIENYPKETLDSIFIQLKQYFGKCVGYRFPDFENNPQTLYIDTDKQQTVHWSMILDEVGKIKDFFQEGLVGDTPIEKEEIAVTMSDGIKLRTIIYKSPKTSDKRPVVLTRTPYLTMIPWEKKAKYFIKRGYIYIIQSIRGMHGSEGQYRLFSSKEVDDGFETINWIEKQDFSDGHVAITGTSYDGFTALAAGVKNPKALKVIFSGGAPSEWEYNAFRNYGVIILDVIDYLRYNHSSQGPVFTKNFRELVKEKLTTGMNQEDFDDVLFGVDIQEWNDILKFNRTPDAPFFKERSIYNGIKNIRVPTYHIAGMRYDGDLIDTVRNFKEANRDSINRYYHHLYLGYWDHGNSTPYAEIGTAEFVKTRYDHLIAYYLKGIETKYAHESRVFMETNSGDFVSGDTYPLTGRTQKYYFSDKGLISTPDKSPLSSEYKFLPDEVTSDEQAVVFELKAEEYIPIWGEINFNLYFSFDTPQMDLIVYIAKKNIKGEVDYVTTCLPSKVVRNTGTVVNTTVTSCPILNTIEKGEYLRITLASNMFPITMRNKNNDVGNDFIAANITFLHSEEFQSSMTLNLALITEKKSNTLFKNKNKGIELWSPEIFRRRN